MRWRLAGLAVVVVAAGCGSRAAPLSKSQYQAHLNAALARFDAAVARVSRTHHVQAASVELRRLDAAAASLQVSINNLGAIRPPVDAADDNAALVEEMRFLRSRLVRLEGTLRNGRSHVLPPLDSGLATASPVKAGAKALLDLLHKGYRLAGARSNPGKEALASELLRDVRAWVRKERLPADAVAGAKVFATAGCTACHTYLGAGSANLNAPDLTTIGNRKIGIALQIKHLQCPSCVSPNSPMPSFTALGHTRLHQLAVFLEASKGSR